MTLFAAHHSTVWGKNQGRTDSGVLVWKEDLNLIHASDLIHAVNDRTKLHRGLDRFAAACIVEAAEKTRNIKPARPHLVQYAAWLQTVHNDIRQGTYSGISKLTTEAVLTDRQAIFEELRPFLQQTASAPAAEAVWRVMGGCRDILIGQVDVLELPWKGTFCTSCTTSCRTPTAPLLSSCSLTGNQA